MSLDVTIIYKKPKMVEYNATHAACGRTVENRKKLLPFNIPQTDGVLMMDLFPG